MIGDKDTVPKYGPVAENAGQVFCLFQGVYGDQIHRDAVLIAVLPHLLYAVGDIGALHTVIDCQLFVVDFHPPGAFGKARGFPMEGKRHQLIAVPGPINDFKAAFLKEFFIGQEGLLLFGGEDADTRFSLCSGVADTILQQSAPISLPAEGTGYPKAIDVKVILSLHRHPCGFQRGVFDKYLSFRVQLAEYMAFRNPFSEPLLFGGYAVLMLFILDGTA